MNTLNGGAKKGRKSLSGNYEKLKSMKSLSSNQCHSLTLLQIKKTTAYKNLTPIAGQKNKSNVYRFGRKSTANKEDLCKYLANPALYHKIVAKSIRSGKKMNPKRDRTGKRIGLCRPLKRMPKKNSCKHVQGFNNLGLTTTGSKCCFKRRQSDKIREQRLAASKNKVKAMKKIENRRKMLKSKKAKKSKKVSEKNKRIRAVKAKNIAIRKRNAARKAAKK